MSREIELAGLRFRIQAYDRLSPPEAAIAGRLEAFGPCGEGDRVAPAFALDLVDEPPWSGAELSCFPDRVSARVEAVGRRIRVSHRRFAAEIDPEAASGRLFSPGRDGAGLEVSLRLALSARLPLFAGIPLHAAAVVWEHRAVGFYGPSGAGKSTLAASSPFRVLSDEFVAIRGRPPVLYATGFWGSFPGLPSAGSIDAPLTALVELAKGRQFRLDRLSPEEALRRLIGVTLVPPVTSLWSAALGVMSQLVRAVPTYRMEWSPLAPPWTALTRALDAATGPRP